MKNYVALIMLIGIFVVVLSGVGSSAACNGDLTAFTGDKCEVSTDLTLNGTYTVYMNGTTSGAINVQGSNFLFDCNNSIIIGNLSANYGISVNSKSNVTIQNCNFRNYTRGAFAFNAVNITFLNDEFNSNTVNMRIQSVNNSLVMGSRILSSSQYGYQILTSNNINITNTIVNWSTLFESASYEAGYVQNSYNINFIGNNFTNSPNAAIYLENTNNSLLSGNIINSSYNYGILLKKASGNNIIVGNLIQNQQRVDGIRAIDYSRNNNISYNVLVNNGNLSLDTGSGIYLGNYSDYSLVSYNNITNARHNGISARSSNNLVYNNNIINSNHHGIDTYGCDGNNPANSASLIYSNLIVDTYKVNGDLKGNGIYLCGSTNNKIYSNNITNVSGYGIILDTSSSNNLVYNNVLNQIGKTVFQFKENNQTSYGNTILSYVLAIYDLYGNTNSTYSDKRIIKTYNGWIQIVLDEKSTYSYLNNTNSTQRSTVGVFNITSPRIYNSTLSSGTIITNTEANLTLAPNKEVYIGDASWS